MAKGRRPDVDSLAALCRWAGLNASDFMRSRDESPTGDSSSFLAMASTYLRSDPNLTPESATALDTMIKTAYEQLREK